MELECFTQVNLHAPVSHCQGGGLTLVTPLMDSPVYQASNFYLQTRMKLDIIDGHLFFTHAQPIRIVRVFVRLSADAHHSPGRGLPHSRLGTPFRPKTPPHHQGILLGATREFNADQHSCSVSISF